MKVKLILGISFNTRDLIRIIFVRQLNFYAQTDEYTNYIKQVKLNAQTLAEELIKRGYTIATNGTDNHTVLVNLKPNIIKWSEKNM